VPSDSHPSADSQNTFRPLRNIVQTLEEEARKAANDLSPDVVEATDVESLIASIVDDYSISPADVDLVPLQMKHKLISSSFAAIPDPKDLTVQLEFVARCNRSAQWLVEKQNGEFWEEVENEYRFYKRYSISAVDSDPTKTANEAWQKDMHAALTLCNKLIDAHRERMREQLRKILTQRKELVLKVNSSARLLGIPLAPVATEVMIPVERRSLTLAEIDTRSRAGEPAHVLAEEIAAELVKTMRSFGSALEHQPVVAGRILGEDEESLRDVLLFILNANWERVGGETFTGEGKTDILFPWNGRNAFIGECKIWHGEKEFSLAIDQLLGYLVWRDVRAGLIIFIRDRKDVGAIINKARHTLRSHSNYKHDSNADDEFVLSSNTDEGRSIRVSLIAVPLPKD
jgi:hypothetical protein